MKSKDIYKYLKDGAIKEDAALWIMLTPINQTNEALSCAKTYFTVVPKKPFQKNVSTFSRLVILKRFQTRERQKKKVREKIRKQ